METRTAISWLSMNATEKRSGIFRPIQKTSHLHGAFRTHEPRRSDDCDGNPDLVELAVKVRVLQRAGFIDRGLYIWWAGQHVATAVRRRNESPITVVA